MQNIFPLNLLLTARGSKVFVEIKSGDTFNGMIELVDKFMNVKLLNVIHTSKDGQQFVQLNEMYIKGSSIKSFRLQSATIDKALEEAEIYNQQQKDERSKKQKFGGRQQKQKQNK
ncbi:RNA processing protein [Paramecium bursaria]